MSIGTLLTDEAWLCEDCTIAECNGDYSGMDDKRQAEVEAAFESLSKDNIICTANFDSENDSGIEEFSWRSCDCCGTHLGGSRHRFAMWKSDI